MGVGLADSQVRIQFRNNSEYLSMPKSESFSIRGTQWGRDANTSCELDFFVVDTSCGSGFSVVQIRFDTLGRLVVTLKIRCYISRMANTDHEISEAALLRAREPINNFTEEQFDCFVTYKAMDDLTRAVLQAVKEDN